MLNEADNQKLTRIGPGTSMGKFLRQYWMPAALSSEVPDCDGEPLRVQLLGEKLIVFRDTHGRVGLVSEQCPHRGASLFFGRNEDDGLRCVYHGWKFNLQGECVDMPNEASDCSLKGRIKLLAYPCLERNDVIWAYLGPRVAPPPLPKLEWNLQNNGTTFLWRSFRACNWVQAMEGDLDSSHINFLHRSLNPDDLSTVPGVPLPGFATAGVKLVQNGGIPRLEALDTEIGVLHASARPTGDGKEYYRVHPFLLPFHTMVGGGINENEISFNGKLWVPMDDERTLILEWQFRPGKSWTDAEIAALKEVRFPYGFLPPTSEAGSAWRSPANYGNDYFIDRSLQKNKLFSGILSNPLQDSAMQESMGSIVDRTKEHLGPSDAVIIKVRRRLLKAATALEESGLAPPGVDDPRLYYVRPVGAILPSGSDWVYHTLKRRNM